MARSRPRQGKHDVRVVPVTFTKDELSHAPEEQRALHFALGTLSNEVVILRSTMWLAINSIKPPEPVTAAAQSTALFAARMLAVRLHDAKELINTKENGQLLDRLWVSLDQSDRHGVHEAAKSAKKNINRYFGKSTNLLSNVRNKLGAHLDPIVMERGFQLLEHDQPLVDHHTGMHGSTLFGSSDTVMAGALASAGGFESPIEGYQTLIDDALDVSAQLQQFIDGYMVAFILTYLGQGHLQAEPQWVRDAPRLSRATIPFFMSVHGFEKERGR